MASIRQSAEGNPETAKGSFERPRRRERWGLTLGIVPAPRLQAAVRRPGLRPTWAWPGLLGGELACAAARSRTVSGTPVVLHPGTAAPPVGRNYCQRFCPRANRAGRRAERPGATRPYVAQTWTVGCRTKALAGRQQVGASSGKESRRSCLAALQAGERIRRLQG
jgi:hypothetical protein